MQRQAPAIGSKRSRRREWHASGAPSIADGGGRFRGTDVSSHPRPARGDPDRVADGGGDASDLRRRRASLSRSGSRSSIRSCVPIHLSWAQELCIYMFVWMAKFGAAYGVRTGIHVGVDVLVNQLSRPCAERSGAVRPAVRRAVHRRDRHHGREVRLRADAHRPGLARSRDAELDRLSLHSRSAPI